MIPISIPKRFCTWVDLANLAINTYCCKFLASDRQNIAIHRKKNH